MSDTLQRLTAAFDAMRERNNEFKATLAANDPSASLKTTRDGILYAAGIRAALAVFYDIVGEQDGK